jgi:uncharacterized protein
MLVIRKWVVYILIFPIRFYQFFLSPYLGTCCRFYPSCSQYVIDAIRIKGPVKGLCLGLWRVLRCGPWSLGGYDPVSSSVEDRESS